MSNINLTERQHHLMSLLVEAARADRQVWSDALVRHKVNRNTIRALSSRGLIDAGNQGYVLTADGWAALELDPPTEAAPAKPKRAKTAKPRKSRSETPPANECGCGCGELCKGLWRPGHDARWAGVVGREIASYVADPDDVWPEAERAAADIGASEALARKVARCAETALAKQVAKAEARKRKAA